MMATVVFHPVGKANEVMRLDVEASNRVEAVNRWVIEVENEGLKPESFVVLGVVGLKNGYAEKLKIEEERRNGQ
jgi:hypothetical protein